MRALFVVALVSAPAFAQFTHDGVMPDGADYLSVPFTVPAGTVELEVQHQSLDPGNILDFGVESPERFRGYGGGNTENAIIGVAASSRSYLTGPITPGEWKVYVGKAKAVVTPARFHLEVTFRTAATLPAQPERRPYQPAAALETTARWYAGDLHVHSRESGDAQPTIDAIATFARGRGLDFVELSEHNTSSQLDFLGDAQARHPQLLLVPGVEFTTYQGHANGIGATAWVDHRLGFGGVTLEQAAAQLKAGGAVFSINHPVLDLGDTCIGCAWKQSLPKDALGAVEIGTGGWDKTGVLFTRQAIAFWDRVLGQGVHAAAVGGSDDHRGGTGTGMFDSPIGNPTTLVFASELSAPAIVDAIRQGRTVVKLQGPSDPMVELTAGTHQVGDVVTEASVELRATVTGGDGQQVRFVVDGVPRDAVAVAGEAFVATLTLPAPASGETRVRAEVLVDGDPRTVTSHLYLAPPTVTEAPKACGCGVGFAPGLLLVLLFWPRRRFHHFAPDV